MKRYTAVLPFIRSQHGTMPTPRGLLRVLLVTLCLSLAQPFVAVAQTSATPLPPAAQEALNKGIIAARVPDYLLAIRYFEEARKLAPHAPVVFLNMGLAESRIPGRELRAIAWFGAYMAAYPDAPNAAAVREQIGTLEVRNQSNVSRFIKTVQDAADHTSSNLASKLNKNIDFKLLETTPFYQPNQDLNPLAIVSALFDIVVGQIAIANAQLEAGDIASAQMSFANTQRIVELIPVSAYRSKQALDAIGSAQASLTERQLESGDVSGALQTSDLIREAGWRSNARRAIAKAQIKAGDFAGAQKTANPLHPQWRGEIQSLIVTAQAQTSVTSASDTSRRGASETRSGGPHAVSVTDWLIKLDDGNKSNACPLNTEPFLRLADYLKTLPPSDDSHKVLESLHKTAKTLVTAQNIIVGMLKQQVKR